jgi:hypothetical protein
VTILPQVGVRTPRKVRRSPDTNPHGFHRDGERLGMNARGRVGCLNADASALARFRFTLPGGFGFRLDVGSEHVLEVEDQCERAVVHAALLTRAVIRRSTDSDGRPSAAWSRMVCLRCRAHRISDFSNCSLQRLNTLHELRDHDSC